MYTKNTQKVHFLATIWPQNTQKRQIPKPRKSLVHKCEEQNVHKKHTKSTQKTHKKYTKNTQIGRGVKIKMWRVVPLSVKKNQRGVSEKMQTYVGSKMYTKNALFSNNLIRPKYTQKSQKSLLHECEEQNVPKMYIKST